LVGTPSEEGALIVYSIAARFGGSGIGYTAYQAVTGIYRAGLLRRLLVSSNDQTVVPGRLLRHWGLAGRALKYLAAKDRTGLLYHVEGNLFDAWVAGQLEPAGIFHGWNGACLHALRRAKGMGMRTVVERASSHPLTQAALLEEEYRRWDIPLRLPQWNLARCVAELEEADYVTVPSAFAAQSLRDAGLPADRLIELPFGVDLTRFRPAAEQAPRPFRAIFAGQLSVRKGLPYLLDAWQRLDWRDAELWLVGAPAPDFMALRRRWPALSNVHFIAHTPDLPAFMTQCDVFVFPSIEEGSALVTYEALACGLPTITTPNAGSVVRDGIEGFLVPIRDAEALAGRLEQLRADDVLRRQMALAARRRAEAYSWHDYQARLLAACRRIVPGAERP
jgi:glycosyltransferase involved in cell wall biosynthesis